MSNILIEVLRVVSPSTTNGLTPSVPSDWTKSPAKPPFAHPGELAAAAGAADDLDAHASSFETVMPTYVAPPSTLAHKLRESLALTVERRRAEAWLAYVGDHELVSWRETLGLVADVRSAWSVAIREGLPAVMPHLATLVGARAESAKRGANTRVRRVKQKGVPSPKP